MEETDNRSLVRLPSLIPALLRFRVPGDTPKAYGKFLLANLPSRFGLCCFLILETKNITWSPTVLFSQPSSLGGLNEEKGEEAGRVGWGRGGGLYGLTGASLRKPLSHGNSIKQEARDLLGRARARNQRPGT